MPEPRRLEIPARLSGRRLDEILAELCPERSRAALQKLVRRGGVKVDGKKVLRSNIRPPRRAKLSVELEQAAPGRSPELSLTVVYEDEHLAVVDKPPGLLTHGNEKDSGDSLARRAALRFGRLPMLMGEERPGIVHRLDRETSGLVMIARTAEAMEELRRMFRAREVRKTYHALVHGAPEREQYSLDQDLAPHPSHPDRQRFVARGEGKEALTEVTVAERLGPCSLLHCSPRTGRRHQLRVHLFADRTPVVGDKLYGAKDAPALPPGSPPVERHLLHAAELALPHPLSGAPLFLEAPPAADFRRIVDSLRP